MSQGVRIQEFKNSRRTKNPAPSSASHHVWQRMEPSLTLLGNQARCAEKQSYFPRRRYADPFPQPTRFPTSRLGSKQIVQLRGRTLPPHLSQ